MNSELLEYFRGQTIGDIWPLDRQVKTVNKSQTITECLKILEDNMILSVPVVEDQTNDKDLKGDFMGLVDTTDIALFVLGSTDEKGITTSSPPSLKSIKENFAKTHVNLESISVGELLEKCNSWKKDRQEDVFPEYYRKSDSLLELVGMFSIGLHRIAILSDDSPPYSKSAIDKEILRHKPKPEPEGPILNVRTGRRLVNLITQSDLLSVLGQALPMFASSLANQTIQQLHLFDKPLVVASPDQTVIEMLAQMRSDSPILTALPIVDKSGTLLATFSTTNLKSLPHAGWNDLSMKCMEFLHKQYENDANKPFPISIQSRKSLHPITCTSDSSLELVIMKMMAARVHRLWCVDNNTKLIGMVSMSDIFQILLPPELFESCFIV